MKTLLIFDVHQNLPWAEAILAKEAGNFDRLILGGDYFDPTATGLPEARETAIWLKGIPARFPDATILLGNHDIPYVEMCGYFRRKQEGIREIRYPYKNPIHICGGHNYAAALEVSETLDHAWFLENCQMHTWAGPYLITHAGLSVHWVKAFGGVQPALDAAEAALRTCHLEYSPLLAPGPARGGDGPIGGITWLDWIAEFCDDSELPAQIVGHTARAGPDYSRRSWCLDGKQTCYGLLDNNGTLEVKGR